MREIFEKLPYETDLCLVSLIRARGSIPQREGAMMLIAPDGRVSGTVGGGALEHKAEQYALRCLAENTPSKTHRFDLTPNPVEDIGMVCGGSAEMLFTLIPSQNELWKECAAVLNERLRDDLLGWLILPLEGNTPCLLDEEGKVLLGKLPDTFENKPHSEPKLEEAFFSLPFRARERVILFGGGHCSFALAPVLDQLGYRVWVYDDRPEYADAERFPTAEKVICAPFSAISETLDLFPSDFCVVMTSGHLHDLEVENQLLRRPLRYVGVMGSKRKISSVNERLRALGIQEEAIQSVHTPIGLPIGAVTPEEIAISVAAELIQLRHHRPAPRVI